MTLKPRTAKLKFPTVTFAVLVLGTVAGLVAAQQRYGRRGYRPAPGGEIVNRNGVPDWPVDPNFKSDLFTFVRLQYGSGNGRGGGWSTDYPDAELNLSYRLQQLTSLKVDPNPKVLEITDDKLFDYPFVYMVEPGRLQFTDEEVVALRRYLTNGGFMMVDDFWGEDEWENFYLEIKRVFPGPRQEPTELPLEHPIFHCVFDLKEKPQLPSIHHAVRARDTGITWEGGFDTREPHYRAIHDDNGRIMVMVCHNTDNGDGWEREGEDEWYFREFSEKKAYPVGINIIFYAMTH